MLKLDYLIMLVLSILGMYLYNPSYYIYRIIVPCIVISSYICLRYFFKGLCKEGEERRKYFTNFTKITSILTVIAFFHASNHATAKIEAYVFWILYFTTLLNLLMCKASSFTRFVLIIVAFSAFPFYIDYTEKNNVERVEELKKTENYNKVYNKIKVTKENFNEKANYKRLTNKNLHEYSKRILKTKDYNLDELLLDIKNKTVFDKNTIYIVNSRKYNCIESSEKLKDVNLDEYGNFICKENNFIKKHDKNYEIINDYYYHFNTKEKLSEVNLIRFKHSELYRLYGFLPVVNWKENRKKWKHISTDLNITAFLEF